MQFDGFLWVLMALGTLLGFFLIRWERISFGKGLGIALIGFVAVALAYVSYQIVANFRQNDLLAVSILALILVGIACIKRARSLLILDVGVALIYLAGLLTVYMAVVIIMAVFFSSTQME